MRELTELNSELESETGELRKANEKLADDEGRWYSLARELESQMAVIKKVSFWMYQCLRLLQRVHGNIEADEVKCSLLFLVAIVERFYVVVC